VRTVNVVFLAPGVQRGLQRLDALKRAVDVEQLALQGTWCSRSIFPVVVGEWIFVSR